MSDYVNIPAPEDCVPFMGIDTESERPCWWTMERMAEVTEKWPWLPPESAERN